MLARNIRRPRPIQSFVSIRSVKYNLFRQLSWPTEHELPTVYPGKVEAVYSMLVSEMASMRQRLTTQADSWGLALHSKEFAQRLDKEDPLHALRDQFHYPTDRIYFLGNSLGLQPKSTAGLIQEELVTWAEWANEGHHTHPYRRPWVNTEEEVETMMEPIVGAMSGEVAIMGSLSANLHILLCAFYRPTAQRYKIVIDGHAFPSDHVLCVHSEPHRP